MPKRPRRSRRALVELLFWPALLLYGEAAVGYFGDMRRPGRAGAGATGGVRLGWLAQTALLAVQVTRDDGFPWGTWASSLSLFVWLVVSAYLLWGCRPAVPAACPRRDAPRGRAPRRRACRRWNRDRKREPLLQPLPRRPRRARARRLRRLHARRGVVRPVHLAGAAARDTSRRDSAQADAGAGDARLARPAHGCVVGAAPHARRRRRARAARRPRGSARRADCG